MAWNCLEHFRGIKFTKPSSEIFNIGLWHLFIIIAAFPFPTCHEHFLRCQNPFKRIFFVNGAALTTNDTDVTISSAGAGISQINGVGHGDVLSGDIDAAVVLVTVTSAADWALWHLNNRNYMLTGDNDGVKVTGNRIDGLDSSASGGSENMANRPSFVPSRGIFVP